jgi:hypothetical protein
VTALVGTASDDAPGVLATGRADIGSVFISMSARHPEGRDAEYIEWHSLDHRPEQHRLTGLRAANRLVSTPACRAARAVSQPPYDAVDHVMTYLFVDSSALDGFAALGAALGRAGRIPELLPPVERGVYAPQGIVAAPRIKIGADVLPWWPATGVYLLVEEGAADPSDLVEVEGVGGAWWMASARSGPAHLNTDSASLQITYCYLDGDPAETGERLRPYLERRWAGSGVTPLMGAPFHTIADHDWGKYLP